MKKNKTVALVQSAVIAAIYASLTLAASMMNLAFGGIQFRFSEALTVLAVFSPTSILGLTVGCLLGNITSPYGIVDIVCGTSATLIASILSYKARNLKLFGLPIPSMLSPVITNAVIVGLEVTFFLPEGFSVWGFLITALQIAVGELTMCVGLGIPLYKVIKKTKLDKKLM